MSPIERPGNRALGTPGAEHSTKVMLLGSGELGKEVVIELQRFGVEFFIRGAPVYFSEVSPRPHDSGHTQPRTRGLSRDSGARHLDGRAFFGC